MLINRFVPHYLGAPPRAFLITPLVSGFPHSLFVWLPRVPLPKPKQKSSNNRSNP